MIDGERIEVLISREKNAASFARKIGTSESTVAKIRSGYARLAPLYERIAKAYPSVNCRWLLTGEGEPFGKEATKEGIADRLDRMTKILEKIDKKI